MKELKWDRDGSKEIVIATAKSFVEILDSRGHKAPGKHFIFNLILLFLSYKEKNNVLYNEMITFFLFDFDVERICPQFLVIF